MMPDRRQRALHQAGHAVVQTLVSRGRYRVSHVELDGPHPPLDQTAPRGEAALDQEVMLGLYEFGLVTLAGIAAENRHMNLNPPQGEPLVALSDLAAWHAEADELLESPARVRMVSLNIMRKLEEWLNDPGIWRVVEDLAEALLLEDMVQGAQLQQIFAPLPATSAAVELETTH